MSTRLSMPVVAAVAVIAFAPAAANGAAAPPVSLAQTGEILLGLLAVLAVFAACVLLLRRLPLLRPARGAAMRIVDALALGARDRLLLVEVEGTRLLLGVTPARIECLHVMSGPAAAPGTAKPAFADQLHRVLGAETRPEARAAGTP